MIFSILFILSWFPQTPDIPDNEVISTHTDIIVDASGTKKTSIETTIQINNRQGDWITKVSIPYAKGNRIIGLEAELTDRHGKTVRTLKKKDITSKSSISRGSWYEDDFTKEFKLVYDDYPYQLRYKYTKVFEEYIGIANWVPYLKYSVPTRHASLKLTKPEDFKIYIYNSDTNIQHTNQNNTHYQWTVKNCPALNWETYGVPYLEQSPRIMITSEKFKYGKKGSCNSWQAYGDWNLALNSDCHDLEEEDKQSIRNKVASIQGDKEKIKALYNQMQDEMRYIYVGIDHGGQKSYPASYVATKKYGDCKALTTYMQSSLDAIGITSYPVFVYAGDYPVQVNEGFPAPQFNHVILCVPLESDTIWLENTSQTLPFNYLGSFTQNRKGLIVKQGESQLIDLPKMTPEEVQSFQRFDILATESGYSTRLKANYQGEYFEYYDGIKTYMSQNDAENDIKSSFFYLGDEVLQWSINEYDRNSPTIGFQAKISGYRNIKHFGPNQILKLPESIFQDLEKPEDRETELRINIPEYLTDSIFFNFGQANFSEIKIPDNQSIQCKEGKYTLQFESLSKQVLVIRQLIIPTSNYQIGSPYTGFYNFIKEIKRLEDESYIVLKP